VELRRLTAEEFLNRIEPTSAFELKKPIFEIKMDFMRLEPKLVTLDDGDLETTTYYGPNPTETDPVSYLEFLSACQNA